MGLHKEITKGDPLLLDIVRLLPFCFNSPGKWVGNWSRVVAIQHQQNYEINRRRFLQAHVLACFVHNFYFFPAVVDDTIVIFI